MPPRAISRVHDATRDKNDNFELPEALRPGRPPFSPWNPALSGAVLRLATLRPWTVMRTADVYYFPSWDVLAEHITSTL